MMKAVPKLLQWPGTAGFQNLLGGTQMNIPTGRAATPQATIKIPNKRVKRRKAGVENIRR